MAKEPEQYEEPDFTPEEEAAMDRYWDEQAKKQQADSNKKPAND